MTPQEIEALKKENKDLKGRVYILEKTNENLKARKRQVIKELKTLIAEGAAAEIEMTKALKAERDALLAQTEVMREQLQIAHDCITCADETGYVQDVGFVDLEAVALELKLAIESTPQQCLRDLKAEAVMGFVAFVFAQYKSGEYHVTAREKYRQLNSRPQGQTVSVHNDPEYCGVLGNAEKYAATVRKGGA